MSRQQFIPLREMGRNHSLEVLASPPITDRKSRDINYAFKIRQDEITKREGVKHGNSAKYFHSYLPQSFNLQHSPSKLSSYFGYNTYFLNS